ncbi:hypothetical protein [Parapedobacter tibetensis]|uniref:hypothetical protein n=1 Tax=Parapedobacter tibetensis TaxID=2972951 RepID=UPI00214D86A3|nr:hypothetical protein [Parapedobacter tibetensis]
MKRQTQFLLLAFLVSIFSCQKEFTENIDDAGSKEIADFTKAGRAYYHRELKVRMQKRLADGRMQILATKSPDRFSADNVHIYSIWKKAYTSQVAGTLALEVPISYSKRLVSLIAVPRDSLGYIPDQTMLSTIFDRLVIYKQQGKESFQQKVIRYHPDKAYLERHKYDVSHNYLTRLDEDFTGYLEYLTLEGDRTAIVRVVDGRPVKRYITRTPNVQLSMKAKDVVPDSADTMTPMSGDWECVEICEPIWAEVCVGNPDPDDPDQDDICYEEIVDEECWEDCYYVDDPEEPEFCDDPYNWDLPECGGEGPGDPGHGYDCNGDLNGSAYMSYCGCIGGNTGLSDCSTDSIQNDPCDAVTKANQIKNKPAVSTGINNIKNSSTEIGYKFFVTSKDNYNTFYVGPAISGGTSVWAPSFTWNPSNGYSIGHMHNHPQGSAPNPTDAMAGIDLAFMQSLHTTSEINFYTKNFSSVIVTSSYIYTITIKNAAQYKIDQANFYANSTSAENTWVTHGQSYLNSNASASVQEAGEYALLKMYGNSINLTRQSVNSNNNNIELRLNTSNKVVSFNPCNP